MIRLLQVLVLLGALGASTAGCVAPPPPIRRAPTTDLLRALTTHEGFWEAGPYSFGFTRGAGEAISEFAQAGDMRAGYLAVCMPLVVAMDLFILPIELLLDFIRWALGPPTGYREPRRGRWPAPGYR
ncbi:MAG: hypothetical protein ACYTGX_12035 [Planctomycetota bacterium]